MARSAAVTAATIVAIFMIIIPLYGHPDGPTE
jgi:hypothetical protein